MKPSILNEEALKEFLKEIGEKDYRFSQIMKEVYEGKISGFDEITTLSSDLKNKLSERFMFESLNEKFVSESKETQAIKFLFETHDGLTIESVLMFHLTGRITLCISSQVGCAIACEFCATGKLGLSRNLEWYEIADQVLKVQRWMTRNFKSGKFKLEGSKVKKQDEIVFEGEDLDDENDNESISLNTVPRIRNIVFMGMGEPLANKENVFGAIDVLTNQKKIGLGSRHVTVSTVGIIPAIKDLSDKFPQVKLAISLHAPTSELRDKFMPINKRFPLEKLMEALDEFTKKTGKRVFYEYVMLEKFNDRLEDAENLGKLLKGRSAHVNLIPWNHVEGTPFHESSIMRQRKFQEILKDYGIPSTVRANLGRDIEGACGQLARKIKNSEKL